jgi:hypothetical protein
LKKQGDNVTERLLTREQVQRTRARIDGATCLLWGENPAKNSPIRRVIDQLTELADDLLHEIEGGHRADVAALCEELEKGD